VAAIVLARAGDGRSTGASVEAALWSALRDEAAPALVASVDSFACALLDGGGGPEAELFALGERVAAAAASQLRMEVRVGIGRSVPVVDARRSFHEARCALEALALGVVAVPNGNGSAPSAGSVAGDRPRVGTYKDLGSFQLLLSLQDDEALRLFCDSILGPIEASEGPYGGELIRSLEAFIEENGQWERAARRLYCHRHTLRYRIRRVEELTGRNLGSARDRIEFWLALRGRQLVS
jgi:purine catabolism regulator